MKSSLGHKHLDEITPFMVEKIKSKLLKQGLSPQTTKHVLALVRQIINRAKDWGMYAGPNPVEKEEDVRDMYDATGRTAKAGKRVANPKGDSGPGKILKFRSSRSEWLAGTAPLGRYEPQGQGHPQRPYRK